MQNKTKNKIITLILFLVMFIALTGPTIVLAQSQYTPLAPLPGITPSTPTNLGTYANTLVKILIGVAAVLAIIMIMIGGLQYMSTDAISGKQEGKERITQALFGLGLAIASWLILTTISPTLLKVDLTVAPIPRPDNFNTRLFGDQNSCDAARTEQSLRNRDNPRCETRDITACIQENVNGRDYHSFIVNTAHCT